MSDLTAEEFVRNKIREQRQIKGEMRALWTYKVSGEDALRWAHEFALLKANDITASVEQALHVVTNCPLCGAETTFLEPDKCMTADCPNCVF